MINAVFCFIARPHILLLNQINSILSLSMKKTPRYRLAIDGRALSGRRAGIGRYTLGILAGLLENQFAWPVTLYVGDTLTQLPFGLPDNWELVPAPQSLPGTRWIGRDAQERGARVILAATTVTTAVFTKVPTITIVYDMSAMRCPEARPSWKTRLAEGIFLRRALAKTARIVAISEFTRDEVAAVCPQVAGKIDVAYGAVDPQFVPRPESERAAIRRKYQLPDNFLLFVGTLEPRKNILRLLAAYEQLPQPLADGYPLVLVGKMGWSAGQIQAAVGRLTKTGRIHWLNYLADAELPQLYSAAALVVYPSLYEGFGLPALEALACGAPLITSATTSLHEVVGDSALTVDPYDVNGLSLAIEQLLTNDAARHQLSQAGPAQARRFAWPKSAQVLMAALDRITQQ